MKMKVTCFRSLLIVFIVTIAFSNSLKSQQSDSIIFKAMNDELNRSMQIKSKGYSSPSFISYTLMYQNSLKIRSQQGALFSSDTKKNADATWRLMIGDYQLNDENFENRSDTRDQDVFYEIAKAPIYPDYDGIRNVLWVLTNYSYKAAAPNHAFKKDIIEKHHLKNNDDLLPDFSTEELVELSIKRPDYLINKSSLEQKSRIYSSAYKHHASVKFAESKINLIQNDIYFLNSEGSRFSIPMDLTQLFVNIKSDFSGENSSSRSLSIFAKTPDDLPSDEDVLMEIDKLVQNITELELAEVLKEDYSGPVLIEGGLVAEVLISNLFSFDFNLNARRHNLIIEDFNKVYFEDIANKLQFKIGEQIFPDHINITSYSRLDAYNGGKLIGNSEVDSEGVIPDDSLVMVKNGILKNLFSSRVPTNVSSKSTGTRRYSFNRDQIGVRSGPATLRFQSDAGKSIAKLTKELISLAKENGSKYAYILRSIPSEIANMPGNCYQLNVETGEEVLVAGAELRYKLKAQVLKNLRGISDSEIVYNTILNSKRYSLIESRETETGLPISFIVPSAILVDNAEIRAQVNNKNLNTIQDEISNPLERGK